MGDPCSNVFLCSFTGGFFCPLETIQPYVAYSCSVVLSALLMRLGYVTNSVFLPMPRFERTENNVPDNVNSDISPWLFYHHFNSMWSPYTRQLIQSRVWFKGQSNTDRSVLFWYEVLFLSCNAVSKPGRKVQQQQSLLHSCCPPIQLGLQLHTGWSQFPVPSSGILPENNWRRDEKTVISLYNFPLAWCILPMGNG